MCKNRMSERYIGWGSLGVLVCLCAPGSAFGQADAGSAQLEEITVFGTKRNVARERLADSVVAVGADEIEKRNLQTVQSLFTQTPNISTYGSDGVAIRGQSQGDFGSELDRSLVTFVVDGVELNAPLWAGGEFGVSTWDVSQVEVFRGPQSVNFGRAAMGGAMYVVTRDPTFESEGIARVQVGEFDTRIASFAYGGPIIDETLAFRFAAEGAQTQGQNRNAFFGAGATETDALNVRLKTLWRPGASDDARVLLTLFQGEFEAANDSGTAQLIDLEGLANRETQWPFQNPESQTADYGSLDLRVSPGGGPWTIHSLTSFLNWENDFRQNVAADGVQPGDFNFEFGEEQGSNGYDQVIQELRLSYAGDTLSGFIGAYFATRETDGDFLAAGLDGVERSFSAATSDVENIDILGELSINFDRFEVSVGARYAQEDQENTTTEQDLTAVGGSAETVRTKASFSEFIPTASLWFEATDTLTLTLLASRGYRPGGQEFNPELVFIGRPAFNTFETEFADNFEMGFRYRSGNGRISANGNVFYTEFTDQQVTGIVGEVPGVPGDLIFATLNAGESEAVGFEADASWLITDSVSVSAAVGYLDAEFTDFVTADGDLTGNEPALAPRWTGNLSLDWNIADDFTVEASADYRDGAFTFIDNFDRIGDRWVTNLRLNWFLSDALDVGIVATNIFDERYFTDNIVDSLFNLAPGRYVGFEARLQLL